MFWITQDERCVFIFKRQFMLPILFCMHMEASRVKFGVARGKKIENSFPDMLLAMQSSN